MQTPKKRARDDQDKALRGQQILQAAARLFEDRPYAELTMDAIAAEAKLAKGTLYLYFRTKEALLLRQVLEQLDEWFNEIESALAQARSEDVPALLAGTMDRRRSLVRLLSILHTALEQNIGIDEAIGFKRQILGWMLRVAPALERALPVLQPGEGLHLLMRMHVLVIGLYPVANPVPHVADALQQPGLELFHVDFRQELEALIATILRGWRPEGAGPGKDSA